MFPNLSAKFGVVIKTMEQRAEGESIRIASEELSQEFKTLMNTDDLNSLNHLQHLM